MARRILIVSPIPSEPRNQGNSARIAVMGELLQSAGWIVHFLYHKLEGLTPTQSAAMARCWDHFHTMEGAPREPYRPAGGPMALDDWYDPALSDFAAALHRRWGFAAVIANYVWCSAVLEALPDTVVKILDTHDVFGGRDEHFRELGLEPAWFWTTVAEEARGLKRAHIVLAIQDAEAEIFRERGHGDVRAIGHLLPLRRRALRPGYSGAPVAGYLASGNPLNVSAFLALRDAFRTKRRRRTAGRLLLVGVICDRIDDAAPFEKHGWVNDADQFYDSVDIVLNPMPGGTGLKIKSVEAVHHGMPLIATKSAMAGLPLCHSAHRLTGPTDVSEAVLTTRWSPKLLNELRSASERCAAEYTSYVKSRYSHFLFYL